MEDLEAERWRLKESYKAAKDEFNRQKTDLDRAKRCHKAAATNLKIKEAAKKELVADCKRLKKVVAEHLESMDEETMKLQTEEQNRSRAKRTLDEIDERMIAYRAASNTGGGTTTPDDEDDEDDEDDVESEREMTRPNNHKASEQRGLEDTNRHARNNAERRERKRPSAEDATNESAAKRQKRSGDRERVENGSKTNGKTNGKTQEKKDPVEEALKVAGLRPLTTNVTLRDNFAKWENEFLPTLKGKRRPGDDTVEDWRTPLLQFDLDLRPYAVLERLEKMAACTVKGLNRKTSDAAPKIDMHFLARVSSNYDSDLHKSTGFASLCLHTFRLNRKKYNQAQTDPNIDPSDKGKGKKRRFLLEDIAEAELKIREARLEKCGLGTLKSKWGRRLTFGEDLEAIIDDLNEFYNDDKDKAGEAILFIIPWERLGVLGKRGKDDLSTIPQWARKWVHERILQPEMRMFYTDLCKKVHKSVRGHYSASGFGPSHATDQWETNIRKDLDNMRRDYAIRVTDDDGLFVPRADRPDECYQERRGDLHWKDVWPTERSPNKITILQYSQNPTNNMGTMVAIKTTHLYELQHNLALHDGTIEAIIRIFVPTSDWEYISPWALTSHEETDTPKDANGWGECDRFFVCHESAALSNHFVCATITVDRQNEKGNIDYWDTDTDENRRSSTYKGFQKTIRRWKSMANLKTTPLSCRQKTCVRHQTSTDCGVWIALRGIFLMRFGRDFDIEMTPQNASSLRRIFGKEVQTRLK